MICSLSWSCQRPSTETVQGHVDLNSMIGQMIMVGFRGMEIDSISQEFLTEIDSGYVGGIILFDYDIGSRSFRRNIKSPEQVRSLIQALQQRSEVPLFVAVDQEGGMVNRLKPSYGFPKTVTAKHLGQLDDLDSTRYYAQANAKTLHELGFNVNFAPVVDIDVNPDNPVIGKYERSFSPKPEIVVKHATEWIKMHDSLHILSTIKHFPGHGSSDQDSHEGITDITKYWMKKELIPFKEISDLDYSVGIMTAHVVNDHLDTLYPATLSRNVISGILREEWGFKGLIFSDDLQMKAVNELFDFETILKQSILAGVDILLFGNNLEYETGIPAQAVRTITKLVQSGEIERNRIEESYQRIMKSKREMDIGL